MKKNWIIALALAASATAATAESTSGSETAKQRDIPAQSLQTTQLQQLVLLTTALVEQNERAEKRWAGPPPPPPKHVASGSVQEPDEKRFCYADGAVFSEGMTHNKKTCARSSTMRLMEDGEDRLARLVWK